jgi:hypothetical protein
MPGDTELSLKEKLISKNFCLQTDKNTDIIGLAQLIANIRYVDGDCITNNFLCKGPLCKQMAMRYFMPLMNIYVKMDITGRTVLVCAAMGRR